MAGFKVITEGRRVVHILIESSFLRNKLFPRDSRLPMPLLGVSGPEWTPLLRQRKRGTVAANGSSVGVACRKCAKKAK
jgi:hypothetical protein